MARGDGKASKGKTRGSTRVKRMLLGGSVDGPAPSNASSMRSGYAGGTSTGGNNFSGGGGGLGNSSREGGFGGAGLGRLESPAARGNTSPGPGNVGPSGGVNRPDYTNINTRRAIQNNAAYTPTGFRGTPGSQPFGGLVPNSTVDALTPTSNWNQTADALDRYSREIGTQVTGMYQRGLAPADPMAANTSMVRDAMLARGPTYSGPSATPASDYRAAPQRPSAPSATPSSDYRGAPGATSPGQDYAEALNDGFQRKAAQFFAEGSPTGFRGTPGSQYFGGQVPGAIGGNALSASRTGRPADTGPSGSGFPGGLADRQPYGRPGSGFPSGLADRQPGVTNVSETPNKFTDRLPQSGTPPKPTPRPAEPNRNNFAGDEPYSDKGGGRGEGGGRRRHNVGGEGPRGRMATGGLVSRGDGRCRVQTKGKMV